MLTTAKTLSEEEEKQNQGLAVLPDIEKIGEKTVPPTTEVTLHFFTVCVLVS